MTWTKREQQFVEAAGRVMWASVWADYMENEVCSVCGDGPDHALHMTQEECIEAFRAQQGGLTCSSLGEHHKFEGSAVGGGVELTKAAPPTPQYALLAAARLLGKLEQANGCGLAVIIRTAYHADMRAARICLGLTTDDLLDDMSNDYVRAFGSAIALEALGHGVRWTDDHEEFSLQENSLEICPQCGGFRDDPMHKGSHVVNIEPHSYGRSFRVPHIEFEYQGEE